MTGLRDARGKLVKGTPALPGAGRPPVPDEVRKEVRAIFAAATPHAAERLVQLMDSEDERIALGAVAHLLDRVLGKPVTNIDASIKTNSIQAAHLAALQEITRRREERAREEREQGDGAKVINIDPRPPMRDAETVEPVVVETVAVATELADAAEPGDEDDSFGTPV